MASTLQEAARSAAAIAKGMSVTLKELLSPTITENYPEVTWLRPASYVVVGLVGLGIANKGMHWFSDFPLGIALGHLFGMIAAHPEDLDLNEGFRPGDVQFSIMPAISSEMAGVSMAIIF